MIRPRSSFVRFTPLLVLLSGCGRVSAPVDAPPSAVVEAARYPVRTDLMSATLISKSPPRWYSTGYPPLESLRLGDRSPDPEFVKELTPLLGKEILDPQAVGQGSAKAVLTNAQRDDLGRLLDRHFGTPLAPVVRTPGWEDVITLELFEPDSSMGVFANIGALAARIQEWAKTEPATNLRKEWHTAQAARVELGLTDDALARGGVLYRRWCLHCHGETGAGDGAQAVHLSAMPRDYRQGVFKFITTNPISAQTKKGKARKDDLKRTVRNGIDGSMMPPFPHLTDQELDDLTGYVIHLSARGEAEFDTIRRVIGLLTNPRDDDPAYSPRFLEQAFSRQLLQAVGDWGKAQEPEARITVPPEESATEGDRIDSALRGYRLFNTTGGCIGCHANYGRTDQLKFDVWGTVVQPRNLVLGVYRGGRKGEDLYARIYGGIAPSTMPGYKDQLAKAPSRPGKPDEVWDIVHFLQVLSDPRLRGVIQDPKVLRRAKERDPTDPILKAIDVVLIE